MKRIGKWLAGVFASALSLVLAVVLLPYASKLAAKLMPDDSAAAIRASAVLSQKLEETAMLETMHVSEEGVMQYEIKAAFIGTVASIDAAYTYEASFGIDLKEVKLDLSGDTLTLVLPKPTLILDSLTPTNIQRDTALYPYLDDNDVQQALENQRLECRERYLSGDQEEALWNATVASMESTVSKWLEEASLYTSVQYKAAE